MMHNSGNNVLFEQLGAGDGILKNKIPEPFILDKGHIPNSDISVLGFLTARPDRFKVGKANELDQQSSSHVAGECCLCYMEIELLAYLSQRSLQINGKTDCCRRFFLPTASPSI